MLFDQPDQDNKKEKTYIPVSAEEEKILSSIYTDGIMRISYIEKEREWRDGNKSKRNRSDTSSYR